MKTIIIILIVLNLTLGVFITANAIIPKEEEQGITILEIRDKIKAEKLDCTKGCEFEIGKIENDYQIKSIRKTNTGEVLYTLK